MKINIKVMKRILFYVLVLQMVMACGDINFDEKTKGEVGEEKDWIELVCVLKYPDEYQTLTLEYVKDEKREAIKDAIVEIRDLSIGGDPVGFERVGETSQWEAPLKIDENSGHKFELKVSAMGRELSATTYFSKIHSFEYKYPGTYFDAYVDANLWNDGSMKYRAPFMYDWYAVWARIVNYDEKKQQWQQSENVVMSQGSECFHIDTFNASDVSVRKDEAWKERAFRDNNFYNRYVTRSVFVTVTNYISFFVDGDFSGNFQDAGDEGFVYPTSEAPSKNSFVVLNVVNKDYDSYLRDKYATELTDEKIDAIYTNIKGGRGIFASELTYYMPWKPAPKQ